MNRTTLNCLPFFLTAALCGCDAAIEPESGDWIFVEDPAQGCGMAPMYLEGNGNFRLDNHGDGTFTIDPLDGTDPFDCDLNGSDFHCPERIAEEVELSSLDPSLSGTARAAVSIDGQFESSTSAMGTQHGTLTCEGSGCAAAASATGTTFPCEFTVEFTARKEQ